jgi:hypothetical protein
MWYTLPWAFDEFFHGEIPYRKISKIQVFEIPRKMIIISQSFLRSLNTSGPTLLSPRVNVGKANGFQGCLCSITYISIILRPKIFDFIPRERELISASSHIKKRFVAALIIE